MIYLIVESGPATGSIVAIEKTKDLIIGRGEDADLRILDERISRKHCQIKNSKENIIIKDLDSRNGTFYKSKKITKVNLDIGERFQAGNSVFRISENQTKSGDTVISDINPFNIEQGFKPDELSNQSEAIFHGENSPQFFKLQSMLQISKTVEEFYSVFFKFLKNYIFYDLAAIITTNSDKTPNLVKTEPARPKFELSSELWEKTVVNGEALLLSAKSKESVIQKGFHSAICVPLRLLQTIIGVLHIEVESKNLSETDFDFVLQCSEVITPPLQRLLEFEKLKNPTKKPKTSVEIIGQSDAFEKNLELLEKVAPTDLPVLITGETGTGKELFARAIYDLSGLKGDFIALNCAAFPKDMLEAELFGYEEGAFTGAAKARKGKVELAHDGVFFLDEISEMPIELQAVLLRVLQEHVFYPLGAERARFSSFRLVTATNKDLAQLVKEGKFREDLFFRIRVFTFQLPPLRERLSDIEELAQHFCKKSSIRLGKKVKCCCKEVIQAFMKYKWPGNVRELENVIERAIVLAESDEIQISDLPLEIADSSKEKTKCDASIFKNENEVITFEEAERRAIARAFKMSGGKKGETAKMLGCSWPTLNKKIKDLNIDLTVDE